MRNAILSGKKGKLDGLGALGVLPLAAAVAAATPVITAVIKILKGSGLVKPGENVDISAADTSGAENDSVSFDESSGSAATARDGGESYPEDGDMEGLDGITSSAAVFARNNPELAIGIGGLVAYGIYKLLDTGSGSKSGSPPRSGIRAKPAGPVPKKHYLTPG